MNRLTSGFQRIAGKLGLAQAAARLGLPRSAVIFMYHGVTGDAGGSGDWEGKHVPASLFRQQVEFLAATRELVPLQQIVEGLVQGQDVSRMAALTFDDGYLNNATTAAPILSELGVPATFFLATGFVDQRRWLWNDRLENALLRTKAQTLSEGGGSSPRSLADIAQRRQTLRDKKREFKQLSWKDAEARVEKLEKSLEVDAGLPQGMHEFMTWDDARGLESRGFSIGAHTVNHALLSRIPLQEAIREITASRDRVIEMIGRCNPVFCYPNGKRADYTDEVVDFCRGEFLAALAAESGLAHVQQLFELRRIAVDGRMAPASLAREMLRAQ